MRAALLALAACSTPHATPPSNTVPTVPSAWPIVELSPVPGKHDCRISQALSARWPREPVASCGIHAIDDRNAMVGGMKCVDDKRAHGEPFVVFVAGHGTDSEIAGAWLGIRERGKLVLYEASYDSDPCGGSCPDRGGTTIRRCRSFDEGVEWWDCTRPVDVARCKFGE